MHLSYLDEFGVVWTKTSSLYFMGELRFSKVILKIKKTFAIFPACADLRLQPSRFTSLLCITDYFTAKCCWALSACPTLG